MSREGKTFSRPQSKSGKKKPNLELSSGAHGLVGTFSQDFETSELKEENLGQ